MPLVLTNINILSSIESSAGLNSFSLPISLFSIVFHLDPSLLINSRVTVGPVGDVDILIIPSLCNNKIAITYAIIMLLHESLCGINKRR